MQPAALVYVRDAENINSHVCSQFFLSILFFLLSKSLFIGIGYMIFGCLSVGLKEACFLRTQKNENGHSVVMVKSRVN